MSEAPTVEQLTGIPREVLWGLIGQYGDEARAATYEHAWQKDQETWTGVGRALAAAASGQRGLEKAAPRWLEPLVRKRLIRMATGRSWTSDMPQLRLLERSGLVTLEPDDDYVLAVVGALGLRQPGGRLVALQQDQELLHRVVWRLFEVEGGGEVSLANLDKYSGREITWAATFQQLVADGSLPREQVLRACLTALGRDFSSYRAGWYSALFVSLAPTTEEVAVEQALLRALLRSDVTATVSFAVKHLRNLHKAGKLDRLETVTALAPAVLCRVTRNGSRPSFGLVKPGSSSCVSSARSRSAAIFFG